MNDREKIYNVDPVSTSGNARIMLVNNTKASAVQTLKTGRKSGSYMLRSSIHKAKVSHFCCGCMRYIQPGETYEKMVRAIDNRIAEFKTHYNPRCDFPEEEYETMDLEEDMVYKEVA